MTRLPRSFVVGLVALVTVVAAVLVGVARWEDGRGATPTTAAPLAYPAETWEQVGPRCSAPTPECQVPEAVEVDGNLLVRTSLQVASSYVLAGADTSRLQARVDLPDRRGWLMTGVVGVRGSAGASGYRVELPDLADEVETSRPLLLRVRGPRTSVPVVVTARDPAGGDGRQFVATYAFHPGSG